MADVIELLRSFNRKERFFLVGQALGNPGFTLDLAFRELLNGALKINVPANAFVAMDYHINWIHASLFLSNVADIDSVHADFYEAMDANQEDIDLIAAYPEGPMLHLVLIEAKGVTGWTNAQLKSKAARFAKVFGADGQQRQGVVPHFVIASPRKPARLDTSGWPVWMAPEGKAPWIPLNVPAGLRKVTRCDAGGHPRITGTFWRAVHERVFREAQ